MPISGLLFLVVVVIGGGLLVTAVGLALYFFLRDREK
jgi:hypothetical protein